MGGTSVSPRSPVSGELDLRSPETSHKRGQLCVSEDGFCALVLPEIARPSSPA